MKISILRGQDQIGGSIIEVSTQRTRVILDVGSELGESDVVVPGIEGLFKGSPAFDAVFVTHYHGDHIGLLDAVLPTIPVYMGAAAARIYETTCEYLGKPHYENMRGFEANEKIEIGDLVITPLLCDHSAFDSYMLLVEDGEKKILYTGDFRSNGRKNFDSLLRRLHPVDVLITEGTTLTGFHALVRTEADLEIDAVRMIEEHGDAPVFVNMAAGNIDRLVTIYRAAKRTGRVLLLDVYSAAIARAAGGNIPRPGDFKDVRTFLAYPSEKNYELLQSFGKAKIGRDSIAKQKFIMLVRPSMQTYLDKLSEQIDFDGGLLLYSLWSGYLEQQNTASFIEFMNEKGVRVESLHTSGHADEKTLIELVEHVNPEVVIPIHTENAAWFDRFGRSQVIHGKNCIEF